jgi:hypothetical protein
MVEHSSIRRPERCVNVERTTTQTAALFAALILAGLICFQLVLAAGLPLGHYAWGGAHQILPRRLRFASLSATVVYILAAVIILEAANVTDLVPFAEPVRNAVWVLAGLFGVGVLMNAISRSKPERLMALVALALSALCVVVALGS